MHVFLLTRVLLMLMLLLLLQFLRWTVGGALQEQHYLEGLICGGIVPFHYREVVQKELHHFSLVTCLLWTFLP